MLDFCRGYTIQDEKKIVASATQPLKALRLALAAARRANSPMWIFRPGVGPRVALVHPDGRTEIPDLDDLVKRK